MDLQGGPTFEDLSIDDELSQLERVVRYSSSSIALQRLVHVKMLAETVAAVGFEQTVKSVVPLLGPLAEDQELVVRQHLGEQLDEIARLCRNGGKEAGYRLIIETVLPTLAKLLGDSQAEVRQAAGESLVGVASLMKPLDLGQHVLTIVLQLAHDDEQEELRMTAAALLNDLAESLGNDLCKQFVTPEMVSLSEDPVFRVRKATALNLHKICKVAGDAGVQRLLPAYVRLTKDDVYRVRKACTEALVEMSKAVGAEVSLRELTPVFLNLASDSSKLVRTGALQHLGRLISTLPGESVSEELLRYFTETAVEGVGDPVADAELRLYCAFSFPAVVVTVGPQRWEELRDSFGVLLRDPSWSVRKTLSHSLHEVAKVLMPDDVESDLVPAMEAFLRDMEDVRLGVIRHLGEFFRCMSPQGRERHLNVLVEILQTTSPFNWRLREVLAQQLPHLAPLLTLDSVFFAVVPVAFGLLNDPVAVVREKTFEVVAPLLQLAGAHSGARQASMVSRVRELAHAHTYQARQMYVYICHSMACSANATHERPLFVKEFVPSLAELARDSVVNVRIAMSRTLSNCPDWVMELPDIRRAIHHLVRDCNSDVRHFVSFLPPILGHELSQEEKQLPWVDSSSVLSDDSVLTQWSMSTQRSMLSVGDFPHLRDACSPNSRSFKIGRQRSSSTESAGESGNSTTSSEGEGLRRLSSRRPPLPSGWGLPISSNSPACSPSSPPFGVAAGVTDDNGGDDIDDGDVDGDDDGSGCPKATEAISEATSGGSPDSGARDGVRGSLSAADDAGGGDRDDGREGGTDAGKGITGGGGDQEGTAIGVADARRERSSVEEEQELGRRGEDSDPPTPPSPRRATSQDPVVVAVSDSAAQEEVEGEGEGAFIPPIVITTIGDGSPLPAAISVAGLTVVEGAGSFAEVGREPTVLPPTPLPNPPAGGGGAFIPGLAFGLDEGAADGGASSRKAVGGGLLTPPRPLDEHAPVWTGDEDEEEEGEEDVGEGSEAFLSRREDGGERRLTPPPWESRMEGWDSGAAAGGGAAATALSFSSVDADGSGFAVAAPVPVVPMAIESKDSVALEEGGMFWVRKEEEEGGVGVR